MASRVKLLLGKSKIVLKNSERQQTLYGYKTLKILFTEIFVFVLLSFYGAIAS